MTQNRSSAVMQQRHEPNDSLDFFPTPPWATRALFEHVIGNCWQMHLGWDPCCGDGAMVNVMDEYMLANAASDVHDYGLERSVKHDFLQPFMPDGIGVAEWILMNPPFRLAPQFIARALELAGHGVAVLTRTAFMEGAHRYNHLFKKHPPAIVAPFVERVAMFKGVLRRPGELYYDPVHKKMKRASTATSYCWLVWSRLAKNPGTQLVWIPPCRTKLERHGDYPSDLKQSQPEQEKVGSHLDL